MTAIKTILQLTIFIVKESVKLLKVSMQSLERWSTPKYEGGLGRRPWKKVLLKIIVKKMYFVKKHLYYVYVVIIQRTFEKVTKRVFL